MLVDLGEAKLWVRKIDKNTLRFRCSPDGRWRAPRSWTQIGDAADPPPPAVSTPVGDGLRWEATPALIAEIDGARQVSIRTLDGRSLLEAGRFESVDGVARWTQAMPETRRFFGFGERTGLLEKRGRRYTNWTTDEWHQGPSTDSLYLAIPWYLSLDPDGTAVGILLDATHRSSFDLSDLDHAAMSMSVDTPDLDWYLLYGSTPAEVVERLTNLVGRPSLPPRWALGYHQARWSYGSADEVREVARALRTHRIPADAIHVDIDHMDGFRVFTWDHQRFPDPKALAAELRAWGFRMTVVVDAAVKREPGYAIYDAGHRHGHFVRTGVDPGSPEVSGYVWPGLSVLPDHLRPEVRSWWGDLYHSYVSAGIAGFLNDMNEPALRDRSIDDPGTRNVEPHPDTPLGPDNERATHAEVRNVWASLQNEATVAGLRRADPQSRPFLLTRSGFAGVQRSASVWTGDNASYWEHLQMSLAQILDLGLSGVPIAGADIGGFLADCPSELLVRWAQLGALYPFARNNSAKGTARQEPWSRGEPTTGRYRRAIELRYRLLPYLYTVAHEATLTGRPVLRPLFFQYPTDPVAQGVDDQALVGRDVLIAPILQPGKRRREVYLPTGEWHDLRSSTRYHGPDHILASATLDEDLPIYLRAGSIVPMAPVMAWSDERPMDPLSLAVVPDSDGVARGSLYEDDGLTMAYADGASAITEFHARRERGAVVVSGHRRGRYRPPARTLEVLVDDEAMSWTARIDDDDAWQVRR
jgi:alpha-glucosidase